MLCHLGWRLNVGGGFDKSAYLTWDDHTELHGTSIFQWQTLIYRSTVNQFGTAAHIGSAGFDSYHDSSVEQGGTYYYWIQWEDRDSGNKSKVSDSVRYPKGTETTDTTIDPVDPVDPVGTDPDETTNQAEVPALSLAQWHEPEIDFGALSQECPRWSDSLENCPYLLEFHGYDIYLGKNLVDNRSEIWNLGTQSFLDSSLFSDFGVIVPRLEEKAKERLDKYFYNEDPDRALSIRLRDFLTAFETVFVPESPNFGKRNSESMMNQVSLLRSLESVPNADPEHPERLGFYIGSVRIKETVPTVSSICLNGVCKTCTNGNCSDGTVLGFFGSGEDVHFPDCKTHAVACYDTREFALGLYLAPTFEENLYVLTHEFGHVWHQLFVPKGYNNSCIAQNYEAAIEANRFQDYGEVTARKHFASEVHAINGLTDSPPARGSQEWLDFWNQRRDGGTSYAASSPYEYFAELTAIWFGSQWDYRGYPSDAGELWEHDLPSYEMIQQAYSQSLITDFPTDCR